MYFFSCKELKSRRKAEILESELKQREEILDRLERHIAALEQQQIHTERDYEQAQLSWEQMQVLYSVPLIISIMQLNNC